MGSSSSELSGAWACRTGQGNREASGLAISLPASRIGAGKSRGLRPADRGRAEACRSGEGIARPEACRSRSAGLRPRDCPAPIREAGREILRPEACRSGSAGLRPRHFPAPVCRPQASRFPCPDLQASGLAISLPRSAGLRPRDFPAQICTPHAPDNPELPAWIQKNRRKNSPVAMSPPRTAGSLHTSEAPNEGDESSMAPGINFKKPPKRQPRLQANSKGLMTSWQQERTPKGGPDLGSISGTGTNGLDSWSFPFPFVILLRGLLRSCNATKRKSQGPVPAAKRLLHNPGNQSQS